MKVSVKVPATSANIGPGFDCLGMALPIYNVVTIDDLREKTISVIKSVGAPILNNLLVDKEVSVFNATLKAKELQEKLFSSLCEEKSFKSMGLKLNSLTVEGIHINSDDLERIRSKVA